MPFMRAVFHKELTGVDGHFAAVPAFGLAADGLVEGLHSEVDGFEIATMR